MIIGTLKTSINKYNNLVLTKPIRTAMVTTGFAWGLGDYCT